MTISITIAALNAHKKRRAAILAYAVRKKATNALDGTKVRNIDYLKAFHAGQKADRERDDALTLLWEACDEYAASQASDSENADSENADSANDWNAGELAAMGAPE